MTASSRQEAIDLTGDDAFHSGSDILEEKGDDELEMMDDEEKRKFLKKQDWIQMIVTNFNKIYC